MDNLSVSFAPYLFCRQIDAGAEFDNAAPIGHLVLDTAATDVQGYTIYSPHVDGDTELWTGIVTPTTRHSQSIKTTFPGDNFRMR